jgi:hypothetical protein
MHDNLNISDLKPWGRNAREYELMFDLELDDFESIASYADGPSSLQADKPNLNICSFDPLYNFTTDAINLEIKRIGGTMLTYLELNKANYHWETFNSPKELVNQRLATAEKFLRHFTTTPAKYYKDTLPNLNSKEYFQLALCSHFLFLFSGDLNTHFHIAAIESIMNHAEELRIFPLVDRHGKTSSHLPHVLDYLHESNLQYEILPTQYRFQKGAYNYLKISKI